MAGSAGQTRPQGITILAILAAIGGVLGILGGISIVFVGGLVATVVGGYGAIVSLLGLILLVLSVVELALAYGFWTLAAWAWQLGVYLEVANVALAVLQLLFGGSSLFGLVITVVIAGIILYYLNTPDVRKAFAAPESGWPVVGEIPGLGGK